jgi:phosphonate transport system substrate-binding protein
MRVLQLRCFVFAALLAAALPVSAQSPGLVLAVNEGVTYRVSSDEIRTRFAGIAADLSQLLGQPVRVEPIGDYASLRKGLADKTFAVALVHPAHVSIAAIKNPGYRLVAVTKGYQDYAARFLVRADSTLTQLADLRGRKLGAPDEDSITAWMARAALRDALGSVAGSDTSKAVAITYTRYQDAVPFMVQHTFTQAGATASAAVVKQWLAQGGKVLATSKAVPIKHVIASPALSDAQVQLLRDYFVALDTTEAGRKKLDAVKVQGYAAFDTAALLVLGTWLGL